MQAGDLSVRIKIVCFEDHLKNRQTIPVPNGTEIFSLLFWAPEYGRKV